MSIKDFSKQELLDILKISLDLKEKYNNNERTNHLAGKTLAMIFEKSSTRTRVSFQVGIYQLGGFGIFLSNNDLQLGRGEIIKDSAAVISSFVDMIMVRTHMHDRLEEFARHSRVSVINGLSDEYHPMQLLADYLTMIENGIFVKEEHFSSIENKVSAPIVSYVGDGNNMANSWLMLASKLGLHLRIACPKKYMPKQRIVDMAKEFCKVSGGTINIGQDIREAVNGANVVTTDAWVSMGQEDQKDERMNDFKDYRVDSGLMQLAHKDAIFLHCLPAYRGLEVSDEVIDGNQSRILQEAHNRLHAQKGVMVWLNNVNKD